MKACKDCIHYKPYLEDYKNVCARTAVYEKYTSILDGYTYEYLKDVKTVYFHRAAWPIFGGCGKMAVYFKAKDKKDE